MADVIKTGVIGTDALLSTNVKPDIDEVLKVLEPYQKPFTSWLFLSKKKSKPVYSQYAKFEWFEKHFYPHYTNVAAAISLTGTTLVLTSSNVGNKDIFGLYDIVLIEEGSQMAYVSSVTGGAGSDVILTHIDGSTTLVALADTTRNIKIIGTRTFEYGGRIDAKQLQEVNVYNYLNEFKRFVTTSGRQQAGQAWTDGLTHKDRVKQKINEMQLEVERYFFKSNSRGYATSGNTRTTWGYGLDGYLSTNVKSYSGVLSIDTFRSFAKAVLSQGSNKKVLFAGPDMMEDIDAFLKSYYSILQTPKELSVIQDFGGTIQTIRIFSGTISIVYDPVLDGSDLGTGYCVDEQYVTLRHMAPDDLGPRKFDVRTTTNPDQRGTETEVLMDVGLQLEQEVTHGKLYKA